MSVWYDLFNSHKYLFSHLITLLFQIFGFFFSLIQIDLVSLFSNTLIKIKLNNHQIIISIYLKLKIIFLKKLEYSAICSSKDK